MKYDVIIVGAGIAGCGLAYNLKKQGYKGTVLVIDKNGVGANKGHYHRNTFTTTLKKYNLPSCKKLKGVKMGLYNKIYIKLNIDFHIINYQKACYKLIKSSDTELKKEESLDIKNNTLITNKNNYKFKFLIDCSGSNFFTSRLFNRPAPFRYWLGHVKVLENSTKINDDYFLYLFADDSYCEEIYFLDNKIIQGDWQYTNKIDFNLINPHQNTFYNCYKEKLNKIEETKAVIPCTPIFPLVYKNIALLGDSFGNATTSAAEGIRPILDSSEILAKAILKNDLDLYEKEWKKRYFKLYYKHLINKMDLNSGLKINKILPKYPKKSEFFRAVSNNKDLALKRLCNEDYKMPSEIRKKFPLSSLIIRQLIYHSYLKLKYAFM